MLKVCAIDLDGVLCRYPGDWLRFINKEKKEKFADLNEAKSNLSFHDYKDLKLKYRKSGIKAKIRAVKDASLLTESLELLGYTIIILTARPIYQIPEVFRDTLAWLKTNEIKYDLLFAGGKDKHIQIIKYFKDLKFMVEDNAEIANNVAELGYKVYLMDNPYNQQDLKQGVVRINQLTEVIENER